MPFDVTEADRQMAHYKLVVTVYPRKKIDEGSQHLLSGEDDGTIDVFNIGKWGRK